MKACSETLPLEQLDSADAVGKPVELTGTCHRQWLGDITLFGRRQHWLVARCAAYAHKQQILKVPKKGFFDMAKKMT